MSSSFPSILNGTEYAGGETPFDLLGISLDDTLGAPFIGYSVACGVFGFLTNQVSNYFQRYVADALILKLLVGTVWSMELLHVILISHAVYHYVITLFGSYETIITQHIIWSLVTQVVVAAVSGIITKTSFILRVWRLSRHNIFITGSLFALVLLQLGWIIAYVIPGYQLKSVLDLNSIKLQGSVALGVGAVADVLIAVALGFYLRKMRTGYKEPDSLVANLTRYALHTGALTSGLSILTLVFYDVRTNTFDYMASYFVLSKTFAVSLMCTLNTRKIAGRSIDEEEEQTTFSILDAERNSATGGELTIPRARSTSFRIRMGSDTAPKPRNHVQPYLIWQTQPQPGRSSNLSSNSNNSKSKAQIAREMKLAAASQAWSSTDSVNVRQMSQIPSQTQESSESETLDVVSQPKAKKA